MGKQQEKKEPLLYIHQPVYKAPTVKMQESFSIKEAERRKLLLLKQREAEKKPEIEKPEQKKRKSPEPKGEFKEGKSVEKETTLNLTPEEVQNTINEYNQSHEKKEPEKRRNAQGLRRVTPFREMEIAEKLNYLYNFPRQLPPVPCLFQTKTNALRGILIEKSDEEIEVKLFDKTVKTIPIKELTEVKMIGLN